MAAASSPGTLHTMRQHAGRFVQTGMARLRATATIMKKNTTDPSTGPSFQTHLTEVAHQSPNRLIPMRSLAMERAGASICALSSYGGGMVQGDSSHVNIHVQPNARLGVITQGSNRIYYSSSSQQVNDESDSATSASSSSSSSLSCQSILRAKVDSDAMLVLAPDPSVPFAKSNFSQEVIIDLHDTSSSSLVLVDWFSAGRLCKGELWHLTRLSSKIKLMVNGILRLVESLALDQSFRQNEDCFGFWCDHTTEPLTTFGSVLLHGDQAAPVVKRFQILQEQLMSNHTSIRPSSTLQVASSQCSLDVSCFRGRVVLGLSASTSQPGAYVVRMAATCTEDLYRVLHFGLQPLSRPFGFEFYKDRLQASQSSPSSRTTRQQLFRDSQFQPATCTAQENGWYPIPCIQTNAHHSRESELLNTQPRQQPVKTASSSWMSLMLADSSLPTGGFAHSASLEAAAQLEWFKSSNGNNEAGALTAYIQAATRSTLQLQIPLVLAGLAMLQTAKDNDSPTATILEQWRQVDNYTHALLDFNAPSCRASLDQGQSLLRIAKLLVKDSPQLQLLDQMQRDMVATTSSASKGHYAPLFGICGGMLLPDQDASERELCTLLGYCTGRTLVSAAIRLNKIGPMASLPLLSKAEQAASEGIQAAYDSIRLQQHPLRQGDFPSRRTTTPSLEQFLNAAASSAPVVDAIHTCHDLLQARLFRT